MDPNTATRVEFTNHLLYETVPDEADPKWAKLVENLKALLDLLVHHEAMAPNLYQTYMTPAANKNKVYFMWDFVGRTLGMLYNVKPELRDMSQNEKKTWEEATGRATFSKMLILDEMPGMLDQMTEQTYPGQRGKHPAFGSDVMDLARKLTDGVGETMLGR